MKRRLFLSLPMVTPWTSKAFASNSPTPAQTEGPFYPFDNIPLRDDLVRFNGGEAHGQQLELSGQIYDHVGSGPSEIRMEIWQCDASGRYRHPHAPRGDAADPYFAGSGAIQVRTGERYQFRTLVPVPYGRRPPHIHVKIFRAEEEKLTTQLYLKGQTGDGALGALTGTRSQLALELKPGSKDAWRAEFDFILGA